MGSYYFTNKAVEDLSDIWNYTKDQWSENQADKYYELIISYCEEISVHQISGNKYSKIMVDLFGVKAGRHIIFYRIIPGDRTEITRILHEKMDLKNRLADER